MKLLLLLLFTFFNVHSNASTCIMDNFDKEVINTASTLKEIEQASLIEGQCKVYRKELRRRNKKEDVQN